MAKTGGPWIGLPRSSIKDPSNILILVFGTDFRISKFVFLQIIFEFGTSWTNWWAPLTWLDF